MISNIDVTWRMDRMHKPTAAAISINPVMMTISFLKGIKDGTIIVMPFKNLKCAIDVNTSITAIAIQPADAGSATSATAAVCRCGNGEWAGDADVQ